MIDEDMLRWQRAVNGELDELRTVDRVEAAPVFNVRARGAFGDGSTDDTSAAQSALDAAETAGGGRVFFPAGDYLVTGDLSGSVRDGLLVGGTGKVVVEGAGMFKSRLTAASGGDSTNLLTVASADIATDVIVRNLGFIGNGVFAAGGSAGVRFRRFDRVILQNCYFEDHAIAGFIGGATDTYESTEFYFLNCLVKGGSQVPFSGVHIYNITGFVVANSQFDGVARAIDLEMTNDMVAQTGVIHGNRIYNGDVSTHSTTNSYTGVKLATANATSQAIYDVSITSNVFRDGNESNGTGRAADIHIQAGNNGSVGIKGVTVQGNISEGFQSSHAEKYVIDLYTTASDGIEDCYVGGNILRNPAAATDAGIRMRLASKSVVAGNAIQGANFTDGIEEHTAASAVLRNRYIGNKTPSYVFADIAGSRSVVIGDDGDRTILLRPQVEISQAGLDIDAILIRNSDVGHGITDIAETDIYCRMDKVQDVAGGLEVEGLKDDGGTSDQALVLRGTLGENASTGQSTGAKGIIHLIAAIQSGTGRGAVNAGGNLLSVADDTNTRMFLDAEGDLFLDATSNPSAYDEHDDVGLLRALELARGAAGLVRSNFDKWLRYNRGDLERLKLARFDDEAGSVFVNQSQLARLLSGAMWQLHQRIAALEGRSDDDQRRQTTERK